MKAAKDSVVTIAYKLYDENAEGVLLQDVREDDAFEFLFGYMDVLPEFEVELEGKEKGHTFEFSIAKDKAYGDYQEQAVIKIPKEVFNIEDEVDEAEILKVGNVLPMVGPDEMPMEGEVKEVNDDHVVMDFNHPLAGKTLYFTGEVLDVRAATEEELQEAKAAVENSDLGGLDFDNLPQ
ncbi:MULTISPECIES: FKBP-type peptidyl-prolyl cis-trans isomerase [Flammeovirga]|uniref:Peptidyl-prolyl cis-trans isomerase n=1 Tax=Flammeovirga agarivorans TaxID=2726742 RepID=A0A7X8XUB7_9BACT|nr:MULTISPECIES: FKBP-type peptidyl-prolyl cis-trans isomerase [Flammeovirga]NLR90242.1 peptidylprolyl isomerase [Flammeovirga agarivorans]